MDIVIPAAPLGVLTLATFFAPYGVSALNAVLPFITKPIHRIILSVVVSLVVAALSLVGYYAITGDQLPNTFGTWFLFAIVGILIVQTSYNLVTKNLGAKALEERIEDGKHAK